MNYTFSLAQAADAPAVFKLYRTMLGIPGCTWTDEYPNEELVAMDIRTESLYLLKDADGTIVAAAAAGPDDELKDFEWGLDNPCELARVAVAYTLQNQGLGFLLLRQVIDAAKARGFDGIRMLVSPENISAQALYRKLGFERLDEVQMFGLHFYRYRMKF